MSCTPYVIGRSKVAKAAILLVAILFTLTSVSPAFAQEVETPAAAQSSSNPASETTDTSNDLDQPITDEQPKDKDIVNSQDLTKEQDKLLKALDRQLKKGDITQDEYDKQKEEILTESQGKEESLMMLSMEVEPEKQTLGKYIAPAISKRKRS